MYTKYKLPTTASFYNRFRLGTMPLGIEVYTLYTTLTEAAPEIDGRWGIALVPGTEQNGTVNHTVSGAGTGLRHNFIFKEQGSRMGVPQMVDLRRYAA